MFTFVWLSNKDTTTVQQLLLLVKVFSMAKTPTSYSLSEEAKEKLRLLSIAERRSMAGELEYLVDKRFDEVGLQISPDWVPPVKPPRPVTSKKVKSSRKPNKGKQ